MTEQILLGILLVLAFGVLDNFLINREHHKILRGQTYGEPVSELAPLERGADVLSMNADDTDWIADMDNRVFIKVEDTNIFVTNYLQLPGRKTLFYADSCMNARPLKKEDAEDVLKTNPDSKLQIVNAKETLEAHGPQKSYIFEL